MHSPTKKTLFELVGGLPTLQNVHKIFYDKVYSHPWLGQFFVGHSQTAIENRQTSFMAEKMGGPSGYLGKDPYLAHRAMFVTDELFELREALLRDSLREASVPEELATRWLRIDGAFRKQIVKPSVEAFYQTTWQYEKRVIVPKPS